VKTKTLIVGALAVLVVGLLWYQFVYSPIKSKTSKANSAAQAAQSDVDSLQHEIDQLNSANQKSQAKNIGTTQMLQAVPADAAEASFLRSLDSLRVRSGAAWQSVTPSVPTTTAGGVTSINVAITVNGSEEQLARYLDGLYSMQRIFIPDNVTVTKAGDLGPAPGALFAGGALQMQVAGRIFAGPAATSTSTSGTGSATTGTSTSGTSTSRTSTSG
jgi:Tfp pilus assembly protein PilO